MARKKAEGQLEQAPASLLARARVALERGEVRGARRMLEEAIASGPPGEREEAQRLLHRTRPDPRALLTVVLVLLLILFAAWAGILRGGSGG
jgi:FimV-like protein